MKKGYWRFLSLIVVALFLGSSAYAMQSYLPQQPVQAEDVTLTEKESGNISEQLTEEKADKPKEVSALPADTNESEKENDVSSAADIKIAAAINEQNLSGGQVIVSVADERAGAEQPNALIQAPEKAETPAAVEKVTQPYSLGAVRSHNMLTRITVKNNGDTTATGIRLQIPLVTSSSPYQVKGEERFSLQPAEIQILEGARVGIFNLSNLAPGAETVLELRYKIKTSAIQFFSDSSGAINGELPRQYLQASKGIESNHTMITGLASSLTQNIKRDWDKAEAITRWVAKNMTYDANSANRNSGALHALQTRKGVCEDYAALSAALARAANVPARVVYGFTDNGTKWPASGSFSLRGFRHAWVEYYLQGFGWVPADPTRSSSKLYFGTLPHNRYIIQNYNDISLRGSFSGGKLSINWTESLE